MLKGLLAMRKKVGFLQTKNGFLSWGKKFTPSLEFEKMYLCQKNFSSNAYECRKGLCKRKVQPLML